ncbi:MAG: hypothetical protein MK180_18090 [Rhodobacteraceae bacterium]|nr:hypothetical protein [Paracoccaceae bacterium]
MKIWIILPDEMLTDDRAYLVGFLKAEFETVWVSRATRVAHACPPPAGRPNVVLNLVGARNPELLADIDRQAAAFDAPVSPPSRGAWRTEDKRSYLEDFPDVSPPTRVVGTMAELQEAWRDFGGDIVVKDPFGYRGDGVIRIQAEDDLPSAAELMQSTLRDEGELIVQPYFSGFSKGDKRILLQRMPDNSFEIIAHIGRLPPEGGWKSNIRSGGEVTRVELTQEERDFALAIAPRAGVDLVALDVASHDGRLWYIEHNQAYGGIIDHDLDYDVANVRRASEFLHHIARHGRPD